MSDFHPHPSTHTATAGGAFLAYILPLLVDSPEKVQVLELTGERSVLIEVQVATDEVRQVIGRAGKTASALRTLLEAIGGRERLRYVLTVQDPLDRMGEVPALEADLEGEG